MNQKKNNKKVVVKRLDPTIFLNKFNKSYNTENDESINNKQDYNKSYYNQNTEEEEEEEEEEEQEKDVYISGDIGDNYEEFDDFYEEISDGKLDYNEEIYRFNSTNGTDGAYGFNASAPYTGDENK